MALTTVAAEVYRDFALDGVPSSEVHEPKKSDIRRLLGGYEQVINAFSSAGGLIFDTRALLYADLAKSANSLAWVVQDPTAAFNGVYKKVGASGTGSWERVADLPYSFIVAEDAGAGTANAIEATSDLPISSSALVLLNIFETNGPGPITVRFNGAEPAYTIKTASGNDPATGGLVAGMQVIGRVSGATFRLYSDQASAAILAQVEALLTYVEAARDEAVAAAADAASIVGFEGLADEQTVKQGTSSTKSPSVLSLVQRLQFDGYLTSKQYGAKADGKDVASVTMTTVAGTTLTASVGTFSPLDVGKTIVVRGAGASGADLFSTIASYSSATVVVLAHPALTTVSGVAAAFGTDDTASINAGLAAASAEGKAFLFVGATGFSLTTDTITIPANVSPKGQGSRSSIIKCTRRDRSVVKTSEYWNGNSASDFAVAHCCTISPGDGGHGFELGASTAYSAVERVHSYDNDNGVLTAGSSNAFVFDKCWSFGNKNNGYLFYNPNCVVTNCYALANGGSGGRWQAQTSGAGATISNFISYGNGGVGGYFGGGPGVPINDIYLSNSLSSSDRDGGFVFDTYGKNHLISNCFAEAAGYIPGTLTLANASAQGYNFTANNTDVFVSNSQSFENASNGVGAACPITWIGGKIDGNGRSGAGYGIASVSTAGKTLIDGVTFANNTSGPLSLAANCGRYVNCPGTSPYGVVTPAVPASGVARRNDTNVFVTIYLAGGAYTGSHQVNGVGAIGTPSVLRLAPGQSIVLTYSSPPTWVWVGE